MHKAQKHKNGRCSIATCDPLLMLYTTHKHHTSNIPPALRSSCSSILFALDVYSGPTIQTERLPHTQERSRGSPIPGQPTIDRRRLTNSFQEFGSNRKLMHTFKYISADILISLTFHDEVMKWKTVDGGKGEKRARVGEKGDG